MGITNQKHIRNLSFQTVLEAEAATLGEDTNISFIRDNGQMYYRDENWTGIFPDGRLVLNTGAGTTNRWVIIAPNILIDRDKDTYIDAEFIGDVDILVHKAMSPLYHSIWRGDDNGLTMSLSNASRDLTIHRGNLVAFGHGAVQSNTAIGQLALNVATGAGWNNIAIGQFSQLVAISGNNNVSLGNNTLYDNISGEENVAIGTEALMRNLGDANVAVGVLSNRDNVTGIWNTSVGSRSLQKNSTGEGNVAVGTQALMNALDALQNTAIGNGSMISAGSGCTSNVAVGNQSLSNTTGDFNVAIGAATLVSNIIGNANVAVGRAALNGNLGSENTALGFEAGLSVTGSRNIFLGHEAGRNDIAIDDRLIIHNKGKTVLLEEYLIEGDMDVVPKNQLLKTNATFTVHKHDNTNSLAFIVQNDDDNQVFSVTDLGVANWLGVTTVVRDGLTSNAGDIIFNTTTQTHQGYDGTIWHELYQAGLTGYIHTAVNGLTESPAGTVRLGGTLDADTLIATAGFDLDISSATGGKFQVVMDDGVSLSSLAVRTTELDFSFQPVGLLNSGTIKIDAASSRIGHYNVVWNYITVGDAITVDDLIGSKGMVYVNDYSALGVLDPRWIPDYAAVQAAIAAASGNNYYNEAPTVTDASPTLSALVNLGTHATDKVINVRVYLNGARMNPGGGNDYTVNALTGVITFTFNLATGDVVLVDYTSQDA